MQRAIGLMSGTSLDGVDAAVVETDGERVARLGPSLTRPYAPALRARLRALIALGDALDPASPELRDVACELTDRHAEAVEALASRMGGARVDLVGFHGQTVLHRPARRFTWQIGDAQRLADRLRVPVVHDFRTADVAAGGEGAPLVPLFHAALLPAHLARPVGVLNIGGVANITFVPEDVAQMLACDTGPGNALLDDLMAARTGQAFDADGATALSGAPDEQILEQLLAHPFFERLPPKSLDRQDFSHALDAVASLSLPDAAATLAHLTARAVAATNVPRSIRTLVVCGGGRRNRAIMAALDATGAAIVTAETLGWDGDALEAQCFGFLAVRAARGLPLSLPGTTGVPHPCPGGRVATPR